MKDRSSWTDEQINEAVAIKKGWKKERVLVGLSVERVQWTNGVLSLPQPPNYTNDWNLCGELLEEMPLPSLTQRVYLLDWACWRYDRLEATKANTPKRAICEEWLEWEEEK